MVRVLLTGLVAAVLVAGCAQPQWPMEPPKKPAVPSEMAKLQPFLGSWIGTAEMVSPSPEEMKKMMPAEKKPGAEPAKEMPKSFAGSSKWEWALGGMYLKGEGWHEMGDGQRESGVEYCTWDPKAGKFRMWSFSDWGKYGEGWMTADADGKTFHFKGQELGCAGKPMQYEGKMTIVNPDTIEWTWKMVGSGGGMEMKGTDKRQK
jgi:hypothetical protein